MHSKLKMETKETLSELLQKIHGFNTNKPLFSVNDPSGRVSKLYQDKWKEIDRQFLNGEWAPFLKENM